MTDKQHSIIPDHNPLTASFETPYQAVPFDKIELQHYLPAFRHAIEQHNSEIQSIIDNPAPASFENTIEAFENSGRLLSVLSSVFFNLNSAETNDRMQELAEKISALLTEHSNDIYLNAALFSGIKTVFQQKDGLSLTTEQLTLLQNTYDGFCDSGANLNDDEKAVYRDLTQKLDIASLTFDKHILKEINDFHLVVEDKEQLNGLSSDFLETAAGKAKEKGVKGWLLDLTAPSYIPAMKFLQNRELRHQLYLAHATKCVHGNETDNKELIATIVNLRLQLANLLGYKTYADYALKDRMAGNSSAVYALLNDLLKAYKPQADTEIVRVKEYAAGLGFQQEMQPWDWAYYAELLKNESYAFNEDILRPYFELSSVIGGVFGLATKLYGITFREIANVPVYHPEVKVFEVNDADGRYIALLYTDFFPRQGKRSGAWMTEFKGQWKDTHGDSRPHISLVMNFTRPTPSKPALLSFDEVNTFLHEFGHALHGMLSDVTYESLSGTNVSRDFVECPSQFKENYIIEKEFLDSFAAHFETGEKISAELIEKLKAARNYNVGYACIRQLGFGLIDMKWHTREQPFNDQVISFEKDAIDAVNLFPPVENTCISSSFSHIFAGGYAAGYYSYKWSEVLAADSFAAFKENGIFNASTAASFRKNILSKGGTEKPMELYKRFRGQEPDIKALLEADGVINNK